MSTPISEVSEFLDVASGKNFFNENTIQSRRTACNKFFEILDEDQQNVEYVRDNLDVIKTRFTNRYTEVRGRTVDVYANRVLLVLKDFLAWKADRSAWERDVAARQSSRTTNADGEKRTRTEKPKPAAGASPTPPKDDDADTHTVTIPLPTGTKVVIKLPRALLVKDLQRVLWALLPYASDWDPSVPTGKMFPQLEDRSNLSA
jgi:hypothetical protein